MQLIQTVITTNKMKNLLMAFGFMLASQLTFGQYFTITPNGFVSDKKEQFVVIEMPKEKQAVLYQNFLAGLSTIYKNPKEVLSLVEGQSITITAYEEKVITNKVRLVLTQIGKTTLKYDVSYTLSIQFKDGKIRINSPIFECRRWYYDSYSQGWKTLPLVETKGVKGSVFDKKGEIVSQESYDGLNKHFNTLIEEIIQKSKTANNW